MNYDEKLKSEIEEFANRIVMSGNDISEKQIKKSDFDKTLIGFVSEKIEREDGSYRWRIQTNGTAYDVAPEMCNITEVGQRVRLYIPNHSFKDKYAEVIDNDSIVCSNLEVNNDKIVFGYSDDTSQEVFITRDVKQRITSFTIGEKTIGVKWND